MLCIFSQKIEAAVPGGFLLRSGSGQVYLSVFECLDALGAEMMSLLEARGAGWYQEEGIRVVRDGNDIWHGWVVMR